MDCYSMALFVVCFDVMIMMTLIFPGTETKMEFTTTEHSGLLLFDGRYDGKHDFIAVEVWQGQVWFRLSLFSHEVIVTSNVNGGVIDSNWHKVEVAFQNRVRIFFGKKFPI